MGMKEIPWLKFTIYLTFFYSIVTILVLFSRPDFVNVSLIIIITPYNNNL